MREVYYDEAMAMREFIDDNIEDIEKFKESLSASGRVIYEIMEEIERNGR